VAGRNENRAASYWDCARTSPAAIVAGAADPGQQRQDLRRPDGDRAAEATGGQPAELFGAPQQESVDGEEDRRRDRPSDMADSQQGVA
jgi:hypothetical protein